MTRESDTPVQRFDRDLIPIEDTRMPARFKRSTRTVDALQPVLEAIQRLGATIDALTELVQANHRAEAEAVELKHAEARHRELQRMVDEAGARVMRGEVRHPPSAAFRAHIFGWSK
jgi:predicted lipoprotein